MAPEKTLNRIWCEAFTASLAAAWLLSFRLPLLSFRLPLLALPLLLLGAILAASLAAWGVGRYRDWRDRRLF